MGGMGLGQTLYYFFKRLIIRYIDDDVSALAAESTYYFILGVVPFMIFFTNTLLFFAAPQIDVIISMLQYLPEQVAETMEANIYYVIEARSSFWLTLGFTAAIWTAVNGVEVIIRAVDRAFFEDRNTQAWWHVKLKSIVFTLLISFGMILSLGLIVFANAVVYAINYYFGISEIFLVLWKWAKYGIPFVILAFSLAAFYRYAPAKRKSKWNRIIPASFLVTVFFLVLTAGYGYYILHISSMGVTYGSLIGLVVLFLWFHLASIIIIMGGEMIMAWDDTVKALAVPITNKEISYRKRENNSFEPQVRQDEEQTK